MKIRFEVTIDDVIARRQLEFFNSMTWRWSYLFVALLFTFILHFAFLFAIAAFEINPLRVFVGAIFVFLLLGGIFAIPRIAARVHRWWTRRSLRGRAARLVLGQHEMELRDWSLIVTTELMQIAFDFRAIRSVVVLAKHALVHVDSTSSFVIPLDRFPERTFRSFVAELYDYWEIRQSGPPTVLRALRMPSPDERFEQLA